MSAADTQALLADLTRAKVLFQARAIAAAMDFPPCRPVRLQAGLATNMVIENCTVINPSCKACGQMICDHSDLEYAGLLP